MIKTSILIVKNYKFLNQNSKEINLYFKFDYSATEV